MNKAKDIFIKIDRVLNWISGGSKTNTISGRVGYYSIHALLITRLYWLFLRYIIDFTFYPLDGPNHCVDSFNRDLTKDDYKPTEWAFFLFILSLIVLLSCLILIIPFYILFLLGVFNKKNL